MFALEHTARHTQLSGTKIVKTASVERFYLPIPTKKKKTTFGETLARPEKKELAKRNKTIFDNTLRTTKKPGDDLLLTTSHSMAALVGTASSGRLSCVPDGPL